MAGVLSLFAVVVVLGLVAGHRQIIKFLGSSPRWSLKKEVLKKLSEIEPVLVEARSDTVIFPVMYRDYMAARKKAEESRLNEKDVMAFSVRPGFPFRRKQKGAFSFPNHGDERQYEEFCEYLVRATLDEKFLPDELDLARKHLGEKHAELLRARIIVKRDDLIVPYTVLAFLAAHLKAYPQYDLRHVKAYVRKGVHLPKDKTMDTAKPKAQEAAPVSTQPAKSAGVRVINFGKDYLRHRRVDPHRPSDPRRLN